MANAVKFKFANVPRQSGEQARLKVVQGPDYGAIYVITGIRAVIGRGEDTDVTLADLKASRRHAEMSMGPGGWSVKDLGSANGILCNGAPAKIATLKNGDTVTLGETTLEFVPGEVGTMMLKAPPKSIAQVQAEHAALQAQKDRVKGFGMGAPAGGPGAGLLKNPKVLAIVGVLILALMLLGEDKKPVKTPKKSGDKETRDLASYLPDTDPALSKTADVFFKAGFREYNNGNWLRAKTQFETVLQMYPGHRLASLYIQNCDKSIEEEVKFHLDRGKKEMQAGKLKVAKGHFEAVQRLLFRDQTNPAFAEARDQSVKVAKLMKGEDG
jgi:pSer/pThr/pTyr-binding forkhead associated (FHA) protein